MTSPPDDTTTDTSAIIAALRAERDAALSEKATLAEALARRNSEYGERIEHQSATIDVLNAMSASPGDAQPVFDLITHRARDICGGYGVSVLEFDGSLIHLRAWTGVSDDPKVREAYMALYPRAPTPELPSGRAILDRQIIRTDDVQSEPWMIGPMIGAIMKSIVSVPMMRRDAVIGVVQMGSRERGGFSDSQIELLKTFAEQAVIAITSAEMYRALQTRTSDLQETLEYQTATSDVLNVISRSTFDLQRVFDTLAETACRLCDADQAAISRRDGEERRLVASFGFPAEYVAHLKSLGAIPADQPSTGNRAWFERQPVHVHDVAAVPGYPDEAIRFGKQRTSLGVPLLREGETVGVIVLARQRVEPFSDRQIELVRTFADQAVIAIENTRLINEQREALEQQTATAEVLQVINASPGDLAPVFDAMLEKAMRLCGAAFGMLYTYDDGLFHTVAHRGVPAALAEYRVRHPPSARPGGSAAPLIEAKCPVHVLDMMEQEFYRDGDATNRATVDLGGARTTLTVPLLKDEALLGAITIYRQEVLAFSDKQIALLENFAAQAVIAMENARLITEQREALEQQTATAEVLQVINVSPGNLVPVFDAVLERALRLCGAAFGMLGTYDGTRFRWEARLGGADRRRGVVVTPEPGSALERVANGQRVVHIPDLVDTDAYRNGIPSRVGLVERSGARAGLWVALRKDDTVLGVILIYRREPRAFSEKQIALLESFAAQAVIAMENARLITETNEALEQQTATAEVLQVINASPGNLTPVFDAMLEKALRLCDATFGMFWQRDGDSFYPAALHGVPKAFADHLMRDPVRPSPNSGLGRTAEGEPFVHITDIADSDAYRSGDPQRRALVDLGGGRTALWVSLRRDGRVPGVFTIYRKEVRPFTDKQIALLQNFAAQAVIAIENARLLTEQREALERQTATAEVLQVINSSPGNLMPVFDAILEKAHRLCGADVGALGFYDGAMFRSVAMHGFPEAHAARARQPWVPTPHQAPLVGGERMVHVADLKAEGPEWDNDITRSANAGTAIRTGLWLPLRKDGVLQGYISSFRNSVRPFSDNEISLLENFAEQAVIAIENARLLNEIQQRQEELRITFENMGDGVAMFDETQHLVAWNRKFQDILDVPDDIIARRRTFSEYVHYLAERGEYGSEADPEEHVRGLIEQAGQSRTYERTRPDGRVIEIRHNPVPGGGFVLIYADITERKRNEAEIRAARDAAEEASRTIEAAYRDLKTAQANLIQAEKMASLGQLTAGIAHEIKNPLNFVNNFSALSTELIDELRDVLAPEPLGETARTEVDDLTTLLKGNLEKVVQHGQRADGIVRSMLDHSRGSSGERRMVDLNGLIDEALNLAYHGARAQDQTFNITLERVFGEGIAPIEVNPQDITRVFLNIFGNGFYATTKRVRDGGEAAFVPTLKVTTRDAGEAVEIRVRDNGTGILADIRDKLFQPFFTTKPTGEGTGLGLSITYDIITQQHGGSIAVDSKVGDYSEFTIRLPRKP